MLGHAPVCVADEPPVAPAAGMLVAPDDAVDPVVAALAIAAPPPASAPVTANAAKTAFIDLMVVSLGGCCWWPPFKPPHLSAAYRDAEGLLITESARAPAQTLNSYTISPQGRRGSQSGEM
jgi:hypothetical protein